MGGGRAAAVFLTPVSHCYCNVEPAGGSGSARWPE